MGEITKIVVENYPVERLPEDLRRGLEKAGIVTVTLEAGQGTAAAPRRSLRSFIGSAPGVYASPDEAVEYVRRLRDESDR